MAGNHHPSSTQRSRNRFINSSTQTPFNPWKFVTLLLSMLIVYRAFQQPHCQMQQLSGLIQSKTNINEIWPKIIWLMSFPSRYVAKYVEREISYSVCFSSSFFTFFGSFFLVSLFFPDGFCWFTNMNITQRFILYHTLYSTGYQWYNCSQ